MRYRRSFERESTRVLCLMISASLARCVPRRAGCRSRHRVSRPRSGHDRLRNRVACRREAGRGRRLDLGRGRRNGLCLDRLASVARSSTASNLPVPVSPGGKVVWHVRPRAQRRARRLWLDLPEGYHVNSASAAGATRAPQPRRHLRVLCDHYDPASTADDLAGLPMRSRNGGRGRALYSGRPAEASGSSSRRTADS